MKFSLFTALLFSIEWMSFEVAADDRTPPSCCLRTSDTKIPVENIVRYEIQEKLPCPVRAIRLHTKKNKVICSDPDSSWAKKAMESVQRRTTTTSQQSNKCYTSPTDLIVTTTNKPPITEPDTTMSTTEPTTVTKITKITTFRQTTSTSTTLSTTEMTIKTSTSTTSTSTLEPTTVTTVKIPGKNMENNKTPTQTISDDPMSSLNTATTCGTGEPTPTETTSRVTSTTPAKRTKPSPIKMKLLKRKSKNVLRKYQMGLQKKKKE